MQNNFYSQAIEFCKNDVSKDSIFIDIMTSKIFHSSQLKFEKWHILSVAFQIYSFQPFGFVTQDNDWLKLKDINFNTLDVSFFQICSMIMTFGDFNESGSKLDPINFDSWTKLSIAFSLINSNSVQDDLPFKQIAWMCARFPSLQELELHYKTLWDPEILSGFLFKDHEKYGSYLKQIKTLWSKSNIQLTVSFKNNYLQNI